MAQQWITPAGSLGNLLFGIPASIQLEAFDNTNSGATAIWTLSGTNTLPTGLTLSPTGLLSGTPQRSPETPAYETTVTYSFVVRLTSTDGSTTVNETGAIQPYRTFKLYISNTATGDFSWVTSEGNLGTIPSGEFYKLQVQAESIIAGDAITYSHVSGELPSGMQLVSNGYLQGVPIFVTPMSVNESKNYRFTIRATNKSVQIIDRSFNLTVTNVNGPTIKPDAVSLGSHFDGNFYRQQLTVSELNPAASIQWSIVKGSLPKGLTLDQNGLISGWAEPIDTVGQYGPDGYAGNDSDNVGLTGVMTNSNIDGTTLRVGHVDSGTVVVGMELSGVGVSPNTYIVKPLLDNNGNSVNLWTVSNSQIVSTTTITGVVKNTYLQQQYDGVSTLDNNLVHVPYDFNQITENLSYSFTVQAFDGANYDTQNYVIDIVSRGAWTADSTVIDNNTYLTTDAGNVYFPVLFNTVTTLPAARQASWYAFRLLGHDFQGDTVTYNAANEAGTFDAYLPGVDNGFDALPFDDAGATGTSVLPGLLIDDQTGWVYGNVTPQGESYKEYRFGFYVSKTRDGITSNSTPVYFTLPVLGDVNNVVSWITPSDLGTIDNGSVSELFVEATSPLNLPITYSVEDFANVSARLPQGLRLLSTGEISGRATFEAFTLDNYTTTFDGGYLTIDRDHKFTVNAAVTTASGTISSTREFTLTLNVIDETPYENLYLRAMPPKDQRQVYSDLITDNSIFAEDLIYRPTDPWFGVRKHLEMLFISGLNPGDLELYQAAIKQNHWTKSYNFGDIKTASVLADDYSVKYDIVYVELHDPAENINGKGPVLELDLSGVITNPYIDAQGNTYTIAYPNTSENMLTRLEAGVGYADQSSLPPWMTSNQPDPLNPNKFLTPLGYTKAAVICYAQPGKGKKISYLLEKKGFNFNNIEFTVDRYLADDYYTRYYNPALQSYVGGTETTFDAAQRGVGNIVATVNYAVIVPFSEINGRPVNYIRDAGGIDGRRDFQNGQTLIFARQENYQSNAPYYGWNNFTNAYLGDDITTSAIEGYPITGYPGESGSFDSYTSIPGYLEKINGTSDVNQRGGVWQINIINNIVYLTFVKEIQLNDRVRVLNGKSYSGAILYYNPILTTGLTVPYYKIYDITSVGITKPTTFNKNTTKFFSNRDQYYQPDSYDKYLGFPQHGVF